MNLRISWLSLISVLLVLTACSRDPNVAKQKYLQSGQQYFDNGEYGRASIQFRKALQIDHRYAEAYYRLGLTDLKLKLWPDAFRSLDQATALDPSNVNAHLRLAELNIGAKQWENARQQIAEAIAADPQNAEAYLLSGQVEMLDHHYQDAQQALEKAEALAPKDARPETGLGEVDAVLGRYADAEKHYSRATELDPSLQMAYLNLAQLYRVENKPESVVQVLQQAIQANPKEPLPYIALANFYTSSGRSSEVDPVFQKLRYATAGSGPTLLSISDFYLREGDDLRAKSVIQELVLREPKNDDAKRQLLKVQLNLQEWDAAEKVNRELMAAYPKDPECRLAEGQLLLAHGKKQEAITKLQELVNDVPEMATAHFSLAMAYNQVPDYSRVLNSLQDSVARDPDFIPGYLALSDFYLQRQDGKTGMVYANEALKRNPNLFAAQIYQANALLLLGELGRAQQEFVSLAQAQPASPILRERVGYLELRQKNYLQAEKDFEQALQLQPDFLPAMRDLVELYGVQRRPDKAIARIQQQILVAPKQADFYELLGNTYMSTSDYGSAETAFHKAIDLNPNAYVAHSQLARIYANQKRFPEAIAQAQAAVEAHADVLSGYLLLGSLYERTGAYDLAKSNYEQAIQHDPNFALGLNDLAWLYCEHGGNLDLALSMAQRAKQNRPNDPQISDTLAWVEYRKGLYDSASGLLRDSLRQVPDSGLFQYHLGMVLMKSGKQAEAKAILARALNSNLSQPDAEQARAALKQLESM
jgi:tetratricopeptide (TPR) repeat protein